MNAPRNTYMIGGGIGTLAAAAFMIRDGNVEGKTITIFEALPLLGGSLDAAGSPETGYSLRGEVARMLRVIVAAQDADPDGWLGGPGNRPAPDDGDQYWVGWDVAYALMQYAEAAPAEAPQMRRAVVKYALEAARRMRGGAPLAGWSAVRWPEWVHLLLHALDTFPSLTRDERAGLRDAAQLALEQGFDWRRAHAAPGRPMVVPSAHPPPPRAARTTRAPACRPTSWRTRCRSRARGR